MIDTTSANRLFTDFSNLRADLGLSEAQTAQMVLVQPEKESPGGQLRGGVGEFEMALRQIIVLIQELSPFVALGLWVMQVLFTRQLKYKLMVAQVIGLLRGWDMAEAEMTVIKQLARRELLRLGLSEEKAERGATQVVEALARELPPVADTEDQADIQVMLRRIRELAACFPAWEFKENPSGCRVQVALPGDRRHRVSVLCRAKDSAGRPVVEFLALCGKVEGKRLEQVLRKSGQLQLGGFTIRQVRDSEGTERAFFALQHRVPLDGVSESTLTRIIPYLAEHADDLEVELVSSTGNKR